MDIEQLTKHQIILLTLLVSFMTSIATGIVTVSLMNQAPPSVTRTINQIVERTIQTVASSTQGTTIQTQKTIVIKDDDLIAQSIASLQKSVIRITAKGSDTLLARGVILNARGVAVTDRAALVDSGAAAFDAILQDGSRVPLTFIDPSGTSSVASVSLAVGTSTTCTPASIVDSHKLQLGQSIIAISGTGVDRVGEGVIAMLPPSGHTSLETTVSSATPGSLVATILGEVVGITTADSLLQGGGFYTIVRPPAPKSAATSTSPQAKP